ncbi:39S ribosomal protein L10, mitochondrial [Thalassophryne amazonica]|uniref:39S ribosomal protein L10, mitochondrial n=1 Tax=Thalassophryne amazonica TaxID=390379 RepID=UPI001470EA81|nr:39S ribosomal protein L10, mitochondrial [Thalassophryne amazonica]
MPAAIKRHRRRRRKMAATLCAKLLPKHKWLPLVQSVRHYAKAVTRHRKPMHFMKQKLMALTEYVPPKPGVPPGAYPQPEVQQENPFELLLRKIVTNVFQENKMIAVVQNNASTNEDILLLKSRLYKHDITIKFFPKKVMLEFVNDSIFHNMAPLFIGHTALIVSKEPKVKEMLRSLKSSPQMTLLGACIQNTLLSAQGVVKYSQLPSLTVVQGELVSGLTMMTSHTASMFQHQPAHLSALLQQYIKQQSPNSSAEEAT